MIVIDCTEIGAPPPTATGPTWIWRVGRRAAAIRVGRAIRASPFLPERGLLERVLHRMCDVEVQRRDDDETQHEDERPHHGGELGDVGVVEAAPTAADALVHGD